MRVSGAIRVLRTERSLPEDDLDRGDTLIEILMAVLVISIGLIALIGSLLVSTSSSITNRGMVNLDGLLRGFAESARYQIQTRPQDGSTGALFDCTTPASGYRILSDPYPESGPAGTLVVVFAAGFTTANPVWTVKVGASSTFAPTKVLAGGTGDYTILFSAPNSTGSVTVSDGPESATSRLPFTINPTKPGSAGPTYAGYKLTSTLSTCTGAANQPQTQQLTLTLVNQDVQNASSDSLTIAVGNFSPQPVVVTSQLITNSVDVPATVKFTASVTDHTGTQRSTGTVTWTLTGPKNFTCAQSNLASGTATCTISPSYGDQGTYSATAAYAGSGYPNGAAGTTQITLLAAAPQSSISAGYNPTTTPPTLTFTNLITGGGGFSPSSGGAGVTWSIAGSDGSNPSCDSTSGPSNSGDNSSWTCTINSPNVTNVATAVTYTVSATYAPGSNQNYGAVSASSTFAVPVITLTGSQQGNSKISYSETAAIPSGFTDASFSSDQVTWKITSTQPLFSQSTQAPNCNSPENLSSSSCDVTTFQPLFDYTATVTFANDPTQPGYDPNLASTSAKFKVTSS